MGHRIWEAIAASFYHAPDSIPGKWSLAGVVGVAWGMVALAFMLRATTHVTEEERDEQYATEYRIITAANRPVLADGGGRHRAPGVGDGAAPDGDEPAQR